MTTLIATDPATSLKLEMRPKLAITGRDSRVEIDGNGQAKILHSGLKCMTMNTDVCSNDNAEMALLHDYSNMRIAPQCGTIPSAKGYPMSDLPCWSAAPAF
jgi:hypothetical protein